ncbi:helix-turn-helix domain-containing protein [Lysinibacillus telephonicus]|nr:transcriptional regulator [Lysinibacillus telephonicus]
MKKETQQMTDDFGKMLKRLRVEQGLSLNDLSIKTGISSSYINRLEQSKRKSVSFGKLVALSEALGVEPWVLAGSSLNWSKGETIGLKELLLNHQVKYNEKLLSSDVKEILLEILEAILDAEWSKESILSDLQEIGELISELKEI